MFCTSVKKGDRIAQLVLERIFIADLEECDVSWLILFFAVYLLYYKILCALYVDFDGFLFHLFYRIWMIHYEAKGVLDQQVKANKVVKSLVWFCCFFWWYF